MPLARYVFSVDGMKEPFHLWLLFCQTYLSPPYYLSKALQEWTPSTISYHLGDLEKRGFVKVTNYGKKRIYYVDGPVLAAMEIFFQLTGEY